MSLAKFGVARLGKAWLQGVPFSSSAQTIKHLRQTTGAPILDCRKALEAEDGDVTRAFEWLRKRGAAKASDLQKGGRSATDGLVAIVTTPFDAAIVEVTSETDFVARNEEFQNFVQKVGESAALVPPPPSSGVHPITLDALLQQTPSGSDRNLKEELTSLVGRVRENLGLQRAARVVAFPGVVGSYVHGSMGPAIVSEGMSVQLGRSAALVALGTNEVPSAEAMPVIQSVAKKLAMHVVAAKPRFLNVVPEEDLQKERSILTDTLLEENSGKPAHILEKIVDGRLNKFINEVTLLKQAHMAESENPQVSDVLASASKETELQITLEGFALYKAGEMGI